MNDLRKYLYEEHESILLVFDILEEMIQGLCNGDETDAGDVHDLIQLVHFFVEQHHRVKEETYYYPAFRKRTSPCRDGAVRQILAEHSQGQLYGEDLLHAAKNSDLEMDTLIAAATVYIELTRSHIHRENEVLFPLGEKLLSEEEQEAVRQACLTYEREQSPPHTKAFFHNMLESFSARYMER